MKTSRLIFALLIALSSCAVDGNDNDGIEIFSVSFDFSDGTQGWMADFTDYPVAETAEADTVYQWRADHLAAPAATNGHNAFMISCNNVSGDVFMYLKKKIEGLRPNTNYNVVYEIRLVTDAVAGQGIILKAGASDLEPKKVIENNYYVLNIDKGLDTTSGENVIAFGDIGAINSSTNYNSVTKGNSDAYTPFVAKSNSKGELWLILGTDSLYEGITTVYFTNINLVFSVS